MLSSLNFDYQNSERLADIPLHILRAYARSKISQMTVPSFIGQDVTKEELAKYAPEIKTFDWFAIVEYLNERHASSQYTTGYSLLQKQAVEELLYVDDDDSVADGQLAYVGADVGVLPYDSFEEEEERQALIFQRNRAAERMAQEDEEKQKAAKVPLVIVNHDKELSEMELEWTVEDQRDMWRRRVVEFEVEGGSLVSQVQPKGSAVPTIKVVMGVPVPKAKPVIVQYAHSVAEFPFYFMQISAQDPQNPKVELNTSESYVEAVRYCLDVGRDDLMGMKQHVERVLEELVKQGIEFENNSHSNFYSFMGYLFSEDKVAVSFAAAISRILEKRWTAYSLTQKVPASWAKNAVMWVKPKPLTTINPSWLVDYFKYTNFALKCASARGKGELLSDKIYRLPHPDARIQGILEDAMSLRRSTQEQIIIVSTDAASLTRIGWAIYINRIPGIKVFMTPQKGVNEVLNTCIAKTMTDGIAFEYQPATVSNLQLKKSSTLAEQWSTVMEQHRNYFGMKPIKTAGKIVSHYFPSVKGVTYVMSSDPADGTILWVKTHEIGEVESLMDQKMAFSVHRERYLRVTNVKTQFATCRTVYTHRPIMRCGPPVMMSMDIPEQLGDDEVADEIAFEEALEDIRKKPVRKNESGVTPRPVGPVTRRILPVRSAYQEKDVNEEDALLKKPKSILKQPTDKVSEKKQVQVVLSQVHEDLPMFEDYGEGNV
jgi:hypothetical protein